MEQRTIIAIALSLLVLMGYNSLVVKPQKPIVPPFNNSQLIDNKLDTENKPVSTPYQATSPQSAKNDVPTPISIADAASIEDIQIIENKQVKVEISNIGGTIKSVFLKNHSKKLPVTDIFGFANTSGQVFYVDSASANKIRYVYSSNGFRVSKEFEINDSSSDVNFRMDIASDSDMSNLNKDIQAFTIDTSALDEKSAPLTDRSLFEYSISSGNMVLRKGNAFTFSNKDSILKSGSINWAGFRDKYFYTLIVPKSVKFSGYQSKYIDNHKLQVTLIPDANSLSNSQSAHVEFSLFTGLQDLSAKNPPELSQFISFSTFSIVDYIAKAVLHTMKFTHKFLPNWGISIILVSVIVYLLTYPLTLSGMKSMKKMQLIQPRMAQLKEQYKNQPQKMNKEVMGLYKEYGVNPLGGCLPFILQMPVFIGLYQALWRAVDIRGQGFLWIKDLSEPDRLFVFSSNFPIIGNEFNILPLVMAVVMFVQQKLSAKSMVITDSTQLMQQKMMQTIFPVMLGFIFYKFSSGLTLYFTLFYAFSAITQYKMSKLVIK